MEALLLAIYSFFVWLIFIKFKWLPWNKVSQVTVVILQNREAQPVAGTIAFWSAAGGLLLEQPFALAPHGSVAVNTAGLAALTGASGSITVAHDGPYGGLAGKAVALEPGTGFSFDSPLLAKPR